MVLWRKGCEIDSNIWYNRLQKKVGWDVWKGIYCVGSIFVSFCVKFIDEIKVESLKRRIHDVVFKDWPWKWDYLHHCISSEKHSLGTPSENQALCNDRLSSPSLHSFPKPSRLAGNLKLAFNFIILSCWIITAIFNILSENEKHSDFFLLM